MSYVTSRSPSDMELIAEYAVMLALLRRIVVLCDDHTKTAEWRLGRIEDLTKIIIAQVDTEDA